MTKAKVGSELVGKKKASRKYETSPRFGLTAVAECGHEQPGGDQLPVSTGTVGPRHQQPNVVN